MNQQINLYLPEFHVKKDALTLPVMLMILGAVLGLEALVSAYHLGTSFYLNGELGNLQTVLAEETRKTSELDDVLARRSQNTALTERLDAAEGRLDASRQIRDFLSSTKLGNTVGFSEYFKDLSRASMEGMSITEFTFTNGGDEAMIAGQVIDSALVPRYVNNIEQGQSPLRSKRYSPAINRDDVTNQFFSFVLSTTASE